MCHMPFNLTAEECELRERARDAETERMESADSEGHLRASNGNIKKVLETLGEVAMEEDGYERKL